MRRVITAVVACAGLFALSAPAASGYTVDHGANTCTGTATWNVNLAAAYADVFVTTSGAPSCRRLDVAVDNNGNPHVNGSNHAYSDLYRVRLLGVTVTGTDSFAGIATRGPLGHGPLAVVSPNVLNATLVAVNPSPLAGSIEQHTGLASCGEDCYLTEVRWVAAWDRLP